MTSIAFVTSKDHPNLLNDDLLVVEHLKNSNIQVVPTIWNDDSINWDNFPLVVIRSPWDYFYHPIAYKNWLESFKTSKAKLLNPPQSILDNVDKRYILDLKKLNIPIIPTHLVKQGSKLSLESLIKTNNWDEVVIKPVISAGAYGTWRSNLKKSKHDETLFSQQIAKETVFIQAFMPEIQTEGEWSIIYINDKYSHSILKKVSGNDFRIQEEFGGINQAVEPSSEVIKQTQKIIDIQKEKLLYARVDGIIRNGQFLLMELEINEPSLFFEFSEKGIKNFCQAIANFINNIN